VLIRGPVLNSFKLPLALANGEGDVGQPALAKQIGLKPRQLKRFRPAAKADGNLNGCADYNISI
jgi:hypothetical protein